MGVRKVTWKRNDCPSHRTRIRGKKKKREKKIDTLGFWCCTMEKLTLLLFISYFMGCCLQAVYLCKVSALVFLVLDLSRICTTWIMGTNMSSRPQQPGLCVCIAAFTQNASVSYEMQNNLKKLRSYLKMAVVWKPCYVILWQHKYLLYTDKRGTEKWGFKHLLWSRLPHKIDYNYNSRIWKRHPWWLAKLAVPSK